MDCHCHILAPFKCLEVLLYTLLSEWLPDFVDEWAGQATTEDPFTTFRVLNMASKFTTVPVHMNQIDSAPWTNVNWEYSTSMSEWCFTIVWDDEWACTANNMQQIVHIPMAMLQRSVCCTKYICFLTACNLV